MKLKCIDNTDVSLTLGKIYNKIGNPNLCPNYCRIKNDNGEIIPYRLNRFEEVKEFKQVKCITKYGYTYLTVGKVYDVIFETERTFTITNDDDREFDYPRNHFEEVKTMNGDMSPKIKVGNIVELDGGMRGLVVETEDKTQYVYWYSKNHSRANANGTVLNKDIIFKVYEGITNVKPYAALSFNIYGNQNLIWERKLPKVKIPLKEIAEKFNIKSEQIEIEGYE